MSNPDTSHTTKYTTGNSEDGFFILRDGVLIDGTEIVYDLNAASAETTRLTTALKRLASPEAFVLARVSTDEERERMLYAERILQGGEP